MSPPDQQPGSSPSSVLESLGKAIAGARMARGLTTLDLAEQSRIPLRYVEAIEAGEFRSLPGKTFILGFTRTICRLLELDADSIVATVKSELF